MFRKSLFIAGALFAAAFCIWLAHLAYAENFSTLTVIPSSVKLPVDAVQAFRATMPDSSGNATTVPATWSSSNEKVGTIETLTGAFTAISPGTTVIKAARNGQTAAVSVSVEESKIVAIDIAPKNATTSVGSTLQLGAIVTDQFGFPIQTPIRWSSSNPFAGTIDSSSGLFKASGQGITVITVYGGNISAQTLIGVGQNLSPSSADIPGAFLSALFKIFFCPISVVSAPGC